MTEPIIEFIDDEKVFNATKLSKPYGENYKPCKFLRSALAKQLIKKNGYNIIIKKDIKPELRGTWLDIRLYDVYYTWLVGENFGMKRNESFESDYYKLLEEFFGCEIIKQYKIGRYKVDFYLPEYNLVIEYDEKHHENTLRKDLIREEKIKSIFNGILIYRCVEGREIKSLKEITQIIVENGINIEDI